MLRLGTRVRIGGQEAQVVARTLAGVPAYDVRLADGRLVKYAAATDFEVIDPGEFLSKPQNPQAQNSQAQDIRRGD
jgi:hypothetical protein